MNRIPIYVAVAVIAVMASFFAGCSSTSKTENDEMPSPFDLPGWELVWQDEFDGSGIDAGKWQHEVNADGGGNNELQYYTDRAENSFVEDGKLVIEARRENFGSGGLARQYTSARLRTLNNGDWLYGRFDIRARLPYGQGIWPAIWMLPSGWEYGGWAASGEIDIMEMLGHEPNKVYATLHFGGEYPNNVQSPGQSKVLQVGTFAGDFHLFTLEWESGEFRWYVDGTQYASVSQWNTASAPYPAPFNKPFHMILNLAVGGNWPGNPDAGTVFPQRMEVDYVRIYRKE